MLEVELLAEYLVENTYASSSLEAYNLIPCMSDTWMSLVLEELEDLILEMRKEDRVKGTPKTPMYSGSITLKGRVEKYKTPEGDISTRVIPAAQRKVPNWKALLGRNKQGMPSEPGRKVPSNFRAYLLDPHNQKRHSQGGGEPGVPQGSQRGVKKKRGANPPVDPKTTPVGRFKEKKKQEQIRKDYDQNNPRGRFGWDR